MSSQLNKHTIFKQELKPTSHDWENILNVNFNYTQAAEEEALKELAFRTLQEWLCSKNFRQKAESHLVRRETTLGQEWLRRYNESQMPWWDEETVRLGRIWKDLLECWCKYRWARFERARRGRPRTAQYPESTLRKARRIYVGAQGYRPDSTWKWAQSVLGESTVHAKTYLVVLHEGVHEELYTKLDPDDLDGLTRDEVAFLLDLPKKFANHFVRYLVVYKGWEVVKARCAGGTKRILRRNSL